MHVGVRAMCTFMLLLSLSEYGQRHFSVREMLMHRCVRVSVEACSIKPQCVSDYSSSSSLCILCVQLQTSLGRVAKGLSRQRWSDQKIPGSLKHTTRALPLLTAGLACREQTSPYKYTDKKKTFLRRVGAPTHSPHNQYVKMWQCCYSSSQRDKRERKKSKGEKQRERKRDIFSPGKSNVLVTVVSDI